MGDRMQNGIKKLSDSMMLNLKILRITGFFPMNRNECSKIKFIAHLIYSFLNNLLYLCSQLNQICYIIQNLKDTELLFRMFPRVLVQNLSILEAVIFWINAKRILRLLEYLDGPEWNNADKHSIKLLKCIPIGSIIVVIFPMMHGIVLWIVSYQHEYLKFPLDVNLPQVLKDPPMKHFLLMFEVYEVSAVGVAEVMVNTTICGFIAHAIAQLKILKVSIENFGKFDKRKKAIKKVKLNDAVMRHQNNISKKNEFTKFIRHYENILRFVREIESTFGWIIFFRFVTSGTIICCSVLQVNWSVTASVEFLFSIIFLMAMVFELAMFCYFGDILTCESIKISDAVYNCDWISTDIPFKRMLLIFMIRTQKPIIIRGGQFFKLTRDTFVVIMKTAYSYYAVLRNLK